MGEANRRLLYHKTSNPCQLFRAALDSPKIHIPRGPGKIIVARFAFHWPGCVDPENESHTPGQIIGGPCEAHIAGGVERAVQSTILPTYACIYPYLTNYYS